MKKYLVIYLLLTIHAVAAEQQQQVMNCPVGTTPANYEAIATNLKGEFVSVYTQSYCKPNEQKQTKACFDNEIPVLYQVIGRNLKGEIVTTDYQSYCRKISN